MAILFHLMTFFGNEIGRSAHFLVERTTHYLNEFVVFVGPTGKGRKGTVADQVLFVMAQADPGWVRDNVRSGISSGEGLIYHTRDASPARTKTAKNDPGVTDKRLMAREGEYSKVLKVMTRDGNTTSATLRLAVDRLVVDQQWR